MIEKLWQAFIVRVFPGTLEEYYAAREIHFREQRKYRRTTQHIVGAALFTRPVFLLLLLGYLPLIPWALVLPVTLGHILVSSAATEHFAFCFSDASGRPLWKVKGLTMRWSERRTAPRPHFEMTSTSGPD